jgi:hypothetical protein
VLKSARIDGQLKASPADGLERFNKEKKTHRLYSADEIDRLCEAALSPRFIEGRLAADGEKGAPLKNAFQFCDYIWFLQYSGAAKAVWSTIAAASVVTRKSCSPGRGPNQRRAGKVRRQLNACPVLRESVKRTGVSSVRNSPQLRDALAMPYPSTIDFLQAVPNP